MSQVQRNSYLEALGVPDFLHAKVNGVAKIVAVDVAKKIVTQKTVVKKIDTQCLVIETQNSQSFCQTGNAQTFLFKMLSAIGLKESDIQCISISANDLTATLEKYDAKTVLLMGESLNPLSVQHFETYHPSEILKNELYKREAWEVLKKVQACLK